MLPAVFFSGPHGSGKTTLINSIIQKNDCFIENDYDINFLTEFPNIASLNDFERSLVRLYHRYYTMNYCINKGRTLDNKSILVSRSIYDSIFYIETYYKLGWLEKNNYKLLKKVFNQIPDNPYTVILNPTIEKNLQRLEIRHNRGERKERNNIFSREDTADFIVCMHDIVESYRDINNVLYIEDNDDENIDRVIGWVQKNGKY